MHVDYEHLFAEAVDRVLNSNDFSLLCDLVNYTTLPFSFFDEIANFLISLGFLCDQEAFELPTFISTIFEGREVRLPAFASITVERDELFNILYIFIHNPGLPVEVLEKFALLDVPAHHFLFTFKLLALHNTKLSEPVLLKACAYGSEDLRTKYIATTVLEHPNCPLEVAMMFVVDKHPHIRQLALKVLKKKGA